jgi:hypothetical protein
MPSVTGSAHLEAHADFLPALIRIPSELLELPG